MIDALLEFYLINGEKKTFEYLVEISIGNSLSINKNFPEIELLNIFKICLKKTSFILCMFIIYH